MPDLFSFPIFLLNPKHFLNVSVSNHETCINFGEQDMCIYQNIMRKIFAEKKTVIRGKRSPDEETFILQIVEDNGIICICIGILVINAVNELSYV